MRLCFKPRGAPLGRMAAGGGGDGDAGYTRRGRVMIHYGYKAHVAVDQTHTLIRQASLTAANIVDDAQLESVVVGEHQKS